MSLYRQPFLSQVQVQTRISVNIAHITMPNYSGRRKGKKRKQPGTRLGGDRTHYIWIKRRVPYPQVTTFDCSDTDQLKTVGSDKNNRGELEPNSGLLDREA